MEVLWESFKLLEWQQVVMWVIGGVLIYLAIKRKMEPALLLPMGFGAILVNIPKTGVLDQTVGGLPTAGISEWLCE